MQKTQIRGQYRSTTDSEEKEIIDRGEKYTADHYFVRPGGTLNINGQ